MANVTRAGRDGLIQLPPEAADFFAEGEEIEVMQYTRHLGLWKRWQGRKVTRGTVYSTAAEKYAAIVDRLMGTDPEVALYLAGYIVECRLKWAVCEQWGVTYLDEAEHMIARQEGREYGLTGGGGHDLELLLRLAGNQALHSDEGFHDAWGLCMRWSTDWRYRVPQSILKGAEEHIKAFRSVDTWLKEAR